MIAVTISKRDRAEFDKKVLLRAQAKDPEAFRTLVERYHRPVYNLVWRMLETRLGSAQVEEITQDVFVKIFRALNSFDVNGRAKLSTWILTIATRTALNELRRPRLMVPFDNQPEVDCNGATCPEKELVSQRRARAIRQAISTLNPDHRAALVLREYHDLEYEEISNMLGIEVGTLKSRLSRARQKLKETLKEIHDE